MAVLVMTYAVSLARELADRTIFFSEGKIVEKGTPAEIFSLAKEDRTLKFLMQIL